MAAPVRFSRQRQQPAQASQPDDPSLWKQIGGGVVSGLGMAGNFLDLATGASSVRDILAGENPFDQFLSPLTSDNRIGGRELLEKHGILGKNKKGLDAGDIGGFAAEVALDPGIALGGLGLLKSFGKGGSVLAKAGKQAGTLSRVGRMTTKVGDLADQIPRTALETAATRAGFASADDFLARHGSEAVGGLLSLNKPFGGPLKALGTGPLAQKVGGALDSLGEVARYGKIPGTEFSPGQQLARVFSSDAMGLHTPEIGKATEGLADKRDLIDAGVKKNVARDAIHLLRKGALDDEASTLGRMSAEGVLDLKSLPPDVQAKARTVAEVIQPYKDRFDELLRESKRIGIRVEDFGDPADILYFPRQFVDMIQNYANTMPREDYLRGIKEGTEELRRIIADPKMLEGTFEDAESYFLQQYGDRFITKMPDPSDAAKYTQAATDRHDLIQQLIHRIREVYTPEQRAVGGFGRNVLVDAQDAAIGMEWKLARAGAMLEQVKNFAKPISQFDGSKGSTRSVAELLELAGLDQTSKFDEVLSGAGHGGQRVEREGGALHQLAEAFGMAPTPENLDAIAKMHVAEPVADDLVRLLKGDDIKTAVGPWLQAMDSFTNLFKVGVLNWPARYVRDLTSGQAMNVITGNWSPQAWASAHRLVAGSVDDFTDIPAVQRLLAEQGLEATAENSTDAMRQLLYAHDVFTGMHGRQGAGEVVGGVGVPGLSADLARDFVGIDPITPRRPSTFLGGSSWNPLKLRGVGGELRTENYLAATGERAGKYTDGLNRIVPFIHNLRRGMDPAQAKELVDALQVNYSPSKFSAAERKYLKRAFPFYAFQSKMTKSIIKQLAERPGGGIAQTIRASNEMSEQDGPVPEEISRGLSIPIGETSDGSQRYLAGAGLMHESVFEPFSATNGIPNFGSTLAELGGKLNPLLKGPIEAATGQSLFQQRPLTDLDPALGRTLSNVGLRDTFASGRAKPVIGPQFENFLMNTPISRALTTARTATDSRKLEGGAFPGSIALMNLGTGLRFSDVSPQVQEGILRDAIAQASKDRGATRFETIRFSKADIAAAEKSDPALAAEMVALNAAANELVQRAKRRKKAVKKGS